LALDWEVGRSQRSCSVTGKFFEEGEHYYSALLETKDGFARHDYSEDAWDKLEEKDNFFSFWKTKVLPNTDKGKKLVIDLDAFYAFFCNLAQSQDENKILFRYLVALLLVRKRVLRLDRIEHPEGQSETLFLTDMRTKEPVELPTPQHTPEQLAQAQETLNQIFDCRISPEDF